MGDGQRFLKIGFFSFFLVLNFYSFIFSILGLFKNIFFIKIPSGGKPPQKNQKLLKFFTKQRFNLQGKFFY